MYKFSVDPKRIYGERVRGRTKIYLDTNAWSDLSEGRSDAARRAHDEALRTHEARATIFPLAYATITELIKREINDDSIRQANLMDALSSGVALRGGPHVRDLEVLSAFEFMTTGSHSLPIEQMFTVLVCYISDREIPAVGIGDRPGVLRVAYPSLRWIQQHMRTPELLDHEAVTDEKYVREVSRKIEDARTWATDGSGRLSAKKLLFEEHTAVLNRYILENLRRLVGMEGYFLIHERLERFVTKTPGPAAIAQVVATMPSIALSCKMNVQKMLAGARTQKQDFYDHEHAARAIPYTDAFVTSDRALLDLIRRSKAAESNECRILNSMAALAAYLENFA